MKKDIKFYDKNIDRKSEIVQQSLQIIKLNIIN